MNSPIQQLPESYYVVGCLVFARMLSDARRITLVWSRVSLYMLAIYVICVKESIACMKELRITQGKNERDERFTLHLS